MIPAIRGRNWLFSAFLPFYCGLVFRLVRLSRGRVGFSRVFLVLTFPSFSVTKRLIKYARKTLQLMMSELWKRKGHRMTTWRSIQGQYNRIKMNFNKKNLRKNLFNLLKSAWKKAAVRGEGGPFFCTRRFHHRHVFRSFPEIQWGRGGRDGFVAIQIASNENNNNDYNRGRGGKWAARKKIKRKGHGETEYADSRHRLFPDIGIDG